MSSSVNKIGPVHPAERILIMDAIRGFAILGIFIANLGAGFSYYDPSAENAGAFFHPADHRQFFWEHVLIEGKFYSIFSFLFGWGVALQLQKNSRVSKSPVRLLRVRLTFMLFLGFFHLILLWSGDIITFYALVGFLLLAIRNRKTKYLFIAAIILILLPILIYFLKMKFPLLNAPANWMFGAGDKLDKQLSGFTENYDFYDAVANANYWQLIKLNISGAFLRFGDLFFQSRIWKVLGMFILGYLLGRDKYYYTLLLKPGLLLTIAIAGFVIGLPANYLLAVHMEKHNDYYDLTQNGLVQTVYYALGVAPLAIGYISCFFLLNKTHVGKKLIRPFAAAGKMAFSNYIFQSLVGTIVFFGPGFGMINQVGPVYYTFFAIVVFSIQIIASSFWLKYFEFGPVEWLWRSLTYRRIQVFKKK
jgi:uncharacterized protein